MSTTIPQAPAAERVRLANCPHCWQRPGRPCTITGPAGDHLGRWQRAERRGLIGREDLATVVAGLEVIAAHVRLGGGEDQATEDTRRLAAIRDLLAHFDWEHHDRQLALEAIERIAEGGQA